MVLLLLGVIGVIGDSVIRVIRLLMGGYAATSWVIILLGGERGGEGGGGRGERERERERERKRERERESTHLLSVNL